MVARYLWRKKQNAWGMMLMNNKIYHFAIIVIFYCLWSLWTIMSLSGCSENIPPASSLVSGKVTLSWNEIPGAISYNVYGSQERAKNQGRYPIQQLPIRKGLFNLVIS